MSEPMAHVIREPLPWQGEPTVTECGRPLNDVKEFITRAAMIAKVKREGHTRAAYTSCMTCWQTADRHPLWADNPCAAVERVYHVYGPHPELRNELVALAALVEQHRAEYDVLVAGLAAAPRLDDVRRARQQQPRRTVR